MRREKLQKILSHATGWGDPCLAGLASHQLERTPAHFPSAALSKWHRHGQTPGSI